MQVGNRPVMIPTCLVSAVARSNVPCSDDGAQNTKTMIDDPLLCNIWMKAMCVELGSLAQGYGDTKGTDTINFMLLDEIPNIPADRTVTYARIVVDY